MSWDSKVASRRRQNSSARALPLQQRLRQPAKPAGPIEPRSSHVADPFLQSFLSPSFDAADYLNSTLPPPQVHALSTIPSQEGAVPLAGLSSQAQSLLSQLSVQTTRLTNTLTQLTDEILRSGSRLAYEVELLRGETLTLSEALSDGLLEDVVKFIPGGLQGLSEGRATEAGAIDEIPGRPPKTPVQPDAPVDGGEVGDPAYVSQLRTLTLVRARLDSVIRTFGDAMEFVFPPSELSVSSGFLSVSAPDAGGHDHSTEEKGQQVLKQLRDDVNALLSHSTDPVDGIEQAARRIEHLKDLLQVWKGTSEEKGRARFVDALAKSVEDRHKDLLRETDQSSRRTDDSNPRKSSEGNSEGKPPGGYGFISQIQKFRGGL